jgi:hypothetical protein
VQVANLRKTIAEHWDQIGYSPDQRKYFSAMMTTPNSELTFRIFRAHEKEVEKLKRQLFGMSFLTNVRLRLNALLWELPVLTVFWLIVCCQARRHPESSR